MANMDTGRPRATRIGAVLVVAVVATVVFAATRPATSDRPALPAEVAEALRATAAPAPTSTPFPTLERVDPPAQSGGDEPRPVPTTSTRFAGPSQSCFAQQDVDAPIAATVHWSFDVPDNVAASHCSALRSITTVSDGPPLARVWLASSPVVIAVDQLPGHVHDIEWRRVDGKPAIAYRYERDTPGGTPYRGTGHAVEVGTTTLLVESRAQPATPSLSSVIVSTLRVMLVRSAGADASPTRTPQAIPLPCVTETFAFEIPAFWLPSGPSYCGPITESPIGLNTSNIAERSMRCACFGPLWVTTGPPTIEARPAPIDAAATDGPPQPTVTIHSTWQTERGDGGTIDWFDHTDWDDAAGARHLRTAVVTVDGVSIHVVANREPAHTGPRHDWQDTLDAQAFVIESLTIE